MADEKLTALTSLAALTTDDILYVVDAPAGAATSKKVAVSVLDARYLLEANNLSDLTNAGTARTNLGVAIGSDVFTQRTITGTANRVTVTNGDGVSGNPTLTAPQDIHTGAEPTFNRLTIGTGMVFNGTGGTLRNVDNSYLYAAGATADTKGAYFQISGVDRTGHTGSMKFWANTATAWSGGDDHRVIFGHYNGASTWTSRLVVDRNGLIGMGVGGPWGAKAHIDQSSPTGAMPVLKLDQGDIDVEFVRLVGTSEDGVADRSLVDVADMTTPGALVGWFQMYVQDVQATNPITDGVYYVPFYAAPSA